MIIIEGEEITITAQKIMPRVQLPETRFTLSGEKVIVFPFSLSVHGEGIIRVENDVKNEIGETMPRYDPTANLNRGTVAEGIKLWGFAKKRMDRIEVGTKQSKTGAHKCQATRIREFCYLNVFQNYMRITDLVHPNELYKEGTKQLEA